MIWINPLFSWWNRKVSAPWGSNSFMAMFRSTSETHYWDCFLYGVIENCFPCSGSKTETKKIRIHIYFTLSWNILKAKNISLAIKSERKKSQSKNIFNGESIFFFSSTLPTAVNKAYILYNLRFSSQYFLSNIYIFFV